VAYFNVLFGNRMDKPRKLTKISVIKAGSQVDNLLLAAESIL